MVRLKKTSLLVLMVAIIGIPRLVGVGAFTSIDEPFWLHESANFYYALGQRQFENTIYAHHPAVTTMWIITAGMLAYFPGYRALGQGYLKPGKFDAFLTEHGRTPLQLLVVSRTIQVLIIIVLFLVVYLLLRKVLSDRSAFFTTAFISAAPYFLGQSRLLNHEALLSLFLLISLVSLIVYLNVERAWIFLILSAVAGALGQLTKSSGIPLLPLTMLALLVDALGSRHGARGQRLMNSAKTFGVWLVVMMLAYVLFWPGMWVAPGKMLYEVYGNALSYTFQGTTLEVLPGLDASSFRVGSLRDGLQLYLSNLAWRTSVESWLGLIIGIWLGAVHLAKKEDRALRLIMLYAMLLAISFVLIFSIQLGRKPPHYVLTSFVCLDLIAGLGFSRLIDLLAQRLPNLLKGWSPWFVLGSILTLQLAAAAGSYPYYITYYNPVLEGLQGKSKNPTLNETGYGVGLDQAAAYLSQKAGANEMTVMAANGYGSFSYYFPGHTSPINSLELSDPVIVGMLRDSQYAVVDYYNQGRAGLLAGLEGIKPERAIWINGIEFLRVYRAQDLLGRPDATLP